jgi:hypothetical protein
VVIAGSVPGELPSDAYAQLIGAAAAAAAVYATVAGWFDEPVYRRLRGEIARELSGPFRKYDDIRAAPGGAGRRPRRLVCQGHTSAPASFPSIHR